MRRLPLLAALSALILGGCRTVPPVPISKAPALRGDQVRRAGAGEADAPQGPGWLGRFSRSAVSDEAMFGTQPEASYRDTPVP